MKLSRRNTCKALGAAASLIAAPWASGQANAQTSFPDKAVRVIIPFPPGGSFDVIARLICSRLASLWKQSVVIDNRAGAGGNIGAQMVISAPPDGYTLLFWGDGVLANPLLYAKPPFDALHDISGVALVATAPQVLVSNAQSDIRTVKDILAATHTLNYGTAGNGAPGHLTAELLKRRGGSQLNHVPYRGGTPALTDLMGNQIQLVATGLPGCINLIRGGSVHAVAVSSARRLQILPDVPTVAETLPGFEVDTWFGFMAPKATPPELLQRVSRDIAGVLADPAVAKQLAEGGFVVATSTPAELDAKMVRDLAFWKDLVAKSGARAE